MEVIHMKETVESTQEEAKRILEERISKQEGTPSFPATMIVVIADGQSKGRGTSGRSWVTTKGNLLMTCAFPMEQIPMSKITMLPLGCGIVIVDSIQKYSRIRPSLKWPNDVLLDGLKVAGILIESCSIRNQTWWLVGIGVNVQSHPEELTKERGDAIAVPRSAVCLRMHSDRQVPIATELGVSVANGLLAFLEAIPTYRTSSIVRRWKSHALQNVSYTIRNTGEIVQVLDIESDGQLRIVGSNGQERRLLSTDYFH